MASALPKIASLNKWHIHEPHTSTCEMERQWLLGSFTLARLTLNHHLLTCQTLVLINPMGFVISMCRVRHNEQNFSRISWPISLLLARLKYAHMIPPSSPTPLLTQSFVKVLDDLIRSFKRSALSNRRKLSTIHRVIPSWIHHPRKLVNVQLWFQCPTYGTLNHPNFVFYKLFAYITTILFPHFCRWCGQKEKISIKASRLACLQLKRKFCMQNRDSIMRFNISNFPLYSSP